jgi:hypothetical protein
MTSPPATQPPAAAPPASPPRNAVPPESDAEKTAEIPTVSGPPELEPAAQPTVPRGWAAIIQSHLDTFPRFVTEDQPSLLKRIEFARSGAWTTRPPLEKPQPGAQHKPSTPTGPAAKNTAAPTGPGGPAPKDGKAAVESPVQAARHHGDRIRRLHLAYTYVVDLPLTTIALAVAWAVRSPGRFFTLLMVLSVLTTGLDYIPVLNWFVPDWTTWPYWFARVF